MLSDTEIEVRKHSNCAGHCLRYVSWSWQLDNGTSPEDTGYIIDRDWSPQAKGQGFGKSMTSHPAQNPRGRVLRSELVSEVATRSIFSWLRQTGYPCREEAIRTHSWFNLEDSDDEELVENTDNIDGWQDNAELLKRIEHWRDSIRTTRTPFHLKIPVAPARTPASHIHASGSS